MKKRVALWFKNDLRLSDHAALQQALQSGSEIIPMYCLDPAQFLPGNLGLRRTGAFRAAFLLESLRALEADLRNLGSGLVLCLENAETALPKLVKEWNCSAVFTQEEIGTDERNLLERMKEKLAEQDCEIRTSPPEFLLQPDKLPWRLNQIPDVFTAWRKVVEGIDLPEDFIPRPESVPSPVLPETVFPNLSEFGLELPVVDQRTAFPFRAGEAAAMERIRYYGPESQLLSQYKETRNGLVGTDYSSKLSPWLANGNLSARMVFCELKCYEQEFGANQSTYWLIFELRWRDFFRLMMLKYGPLLFSFHGFRREFSPPAGRDENAFKRWKEGKTGQPFVDAAMRELSATGFMGNRMRQVTASWLVDHMNLDWRLGAGWFEEQLIDYDVASNWGNWAYQAGVGNDPRGKRVFNAERQAEMYDPGKEFQMLWLKA